MNDFHFLRPEWFWALIPLALVLSTLFYNRRVSDWQQLLPAHLSNALFHESTTSRIPFKLLILTITSIITVIALAGPTWKKIEKPVFKAQLANVIVLDMSMSMRSTDVSPDRLTKAKFKAIDLAKAIGEGEVGLVAYAGDAFTISPLTQDARNIASLIPSLTPEIMPIPGSYPLLGIDKAKELMSQAGYLSGQIYWITDGIETEDIDALQKSLKNSPYQVNVLSIGTAAGAPIKMVDGSLLKDRTGSIVMPKVNEAALSNLAKSTGGIFQKFTANDYDVKQLATRNTASLESRTDSVSDSLSGTDTNKNNNITGDDWHEMGPYLLILVLPAMLFLFRRGFSLSVLLCASLMFGVASPNTAIANTEKTVHDETGSNESSKNSYEQPELAKSQEPGLWNRFVDSVFKTPDQRASDAFQNQQFSKAKEEFNDPQWKGAAAYKAADYEAALEHFKQDSSAQGYYNQGNALAQMFEVDAAIAAYEKALELNPNMEEAIYNKDYLEKLKEQTQSQQNQQQNSDQQNSDQQNSDQQNGEQQDRQNSQPQGSQSDQPSQQNQQGSQESSEQQDKSNSNQQGSQPSEQDQQATDEQNASQSSSDSNNDDKDKAGQPQSQSNSDKDKQSKEEQLKAQGGQQSMTPEEIAEMEEQQKIKQLLRKINDDPAILLRNKMILESRRRQQERRRVKGATKSW